MNETVTFENITISEDVTLTVANTKTLTVKGSLDLDDADVTTAGTGTIKGHSDTVKISGQKLIAATVVTLEDIVVEADLEIGADLIFTGKVTTNAVTITGAERTITFSVSTDNWVLLGQVAMGANKITLDAPGIVTGAQTGTGDIDVNATQKAAAVI